MSTTGPVGLPATGGPGGAPLPDYCGPEDLARMLLTMRRWESDEGLEGSISDGGLHRLLELAFQTSLTTEEGRHPRFRFFVAARGAHDPPQPIARFDPPIPLRTDTLRRMVPAVSSRLHALKVVEAKNGGLYGDSVLSVDEMGDAASVGCPEISTGIGIPGLMVRVDGPGRLRATERGSTWELRDGRVRPLNHYATISTVRTWFDELAKRLLEEAGAGRAVAGDPAVVFDAVWSFVLAFTVQASHGGAFAILPGEPGDEIRIKYPARDLDVSRAVTAFWRQCFEPNELEGGAEFRERSHRWDAARRRMFSAARALSELANVDGCVVLDRRLRLFGFGGEIRVAEDKVQGWTCSDAQAQDLAAQGTIDVERWGTRHRSAYRLCCARPGTLVFVVSQDGDLRVFYGNDDRRVCAWQSLGSWMTASDRW